MVEGCDLVLYDNWDYTGNSKSFNRTGPAGDFADRDISAKLVGGCHNTSYLVLEHPWNRDNGGDGYLMGKRDSVGGLWDKHRHQDGQRYWKKGKRANEIIRINIPTENINAKVLRHHLDIHGRRCCSDPDEPRLHIRRESEQSGTNGANSPEQLLANSSDKGQPCPGGEAYWLNATDGQRNSTSASTRKAQVACVYRGKDGLKDLHSSLKGSGDIRKAMYNELVRKYCDRATRLHDRISSDTRDNQCKDVAETKKQQRSWCGSGDKIATDKTFCTKEELGTALYEELAGKYCDANPEDPFCGCYNVVKNKCKGEEIDKEIKELEDGRKPIEGVRHIWFGFDNRQDYLNIAQIEVFSGKDSKGVPINILRKTLADGSEVPNPAVTITASSTHSSGLYGTNHLNDGNYITMFHSAHNPNEWFQVDLGKLTSIDSIKVWNRHDCNGCNSRWRGAFIKLKNSDGDEIKRSERIVGDHMEDGKRVKTFFDNGVAAAKEKLNFPGCKITVPIRRTLTDLPRKYSAALDGTDKCWGNVCASTGGDKYVPEGTIDALCSKSMTICNVDLSTGDLEDSDVTIEQSCGEQEGTPAPMSPPSSGEPSEPSDGSTEGTPAPMDSSSIPLTSTSTSTAVDEVASTEELEIYEEPAVQIGAVTTSIVSLSSCFMLLLVLAM